MAAAKKKSSKSRSARTRLKVVALPEPAAAADPKSEMQSLEAESEPPTSLESGLLGSKAWELMSKIDMLRAELRATGRSYGGNFGTEGQDDRQRAISAALWIAWRALQFVGAEVYWEDDAGGMSFYRVPFMEAANILRGGSRSGSPGHWRKIAEACVASPFMCAPRPTAEQAAPSTIEQLGKHFGSAFRRVETSDVVAIYETAFHEADAAAKSVGGVAFGRFDDGRRRFDEEVRKIVLRATRDVVWLAFKLAEDAGRLGDPSVFSFPMPSFPAKETETSRRVRLLRALGTQQSDDRKRRAVRLRGSDVGASD